MPDQPEPDWSICRYPVRRDIPPKSKRHKPKLNIEACGEPATIIERTPQGKEVRWLCEAHKDWVGWMYEDGNPYGHWRPSKVPDTLD